ncbi:MFS transporter [Actibacterium sp. MT2.3-13A]|uniref:MFS transporter n=1 Tax=Actibacterium sp. MT2.3-13A TaxID=2828332 RepID=UPI001BA782C0|nr:MFS transporter [Actibacterium sp. MT2.3-13A]
MTDTMAEDRLQSGLRAYRWAVLAGLWGLYLCFGLGQVGIAPLVSAVQTDLGLSSSEMGMVLGSWQFLYVFTAIPGALFMLRHGIPTTLTVGGLIVLASLVLRGAAWDFPSLLIAVSLLGAGGPVISIGAPVLVGQLFSGRALGFAMGAYITAPGVANILTYSLSGPVLIPFFGNWRMVLLTWAAISTIFLAGWIPIRSALAGDTGPGGDPERSGLPLSRDRGFLALICLAGAATLFVDHGFRFWGMEVARSAGYDGGSAGLIAALAMALGLLALLVIPPLAVTRGSHIRVAMCLAGLVASGTLAMMGLWGRPYFVAGFLAMGFAVGPLLTIALIPIVGHVRFTPRKRILVVAAFFAVAEIGGTLGPLTFGILCDLTGGFEVALIILLAVALAIPALLFGPGKRLETSQTKGSSE